MRKIETVFISILVFAITSSAQPQNEWIRFYGGNFQDTFTDVFGNTDGGYAMAGQFDPGRDDSYDMWIVRVTADGEQLWSQQYGTEEYESGMSLVQTDAGGFFSGGYTGGRRNDNGWDFAGVLTDGDGQEIWWRNYGGEGHEQCRAVIELKDGNFLMAGYTTSFGAGEEDGYLIKIDGEGDVIWDQTYGMENQDEFYAMREIEDGILLAGVTTIGEDKNFWLVRTDDMGEELWSRNFGGQDWDFCQSLISCRGGGFAMAGSSFDWVERERSNMWLVRLDDEMNPIWDSVIDTDGGEFGIWERCYSVTQNLDGGFTMTGFGRLDNGTTATIARTDNAGNIMWWRHDRNENNGGSFRNYYPATILGPDGSIIAAGSTSRDNFSTQGTLIKLVPERSAPIIIATIPEQLEFSVLPGDSVFFDVDVDDAQNDSIRYVWKFNGEEISTDTCFTQAFEELGNAVKQCIVSDGDQADSVAWLVHVKEFYINEFSPDSTNLEIRRNSSVDFTHHVRAVEDFDFDYRWEHFGRGGNFEFEGEDSVRFDFDLTGDHIIRARIINDDQIETVSWDVFVRSIIWWWWPHELELTTPVDTTMEFVIFPFNEEMDSLEYIWILDNRRLNQDSSVIDLSFDEAGFYELTGICLEGEEADTVRWAVDVQERSFTTDEADLTDLSKTPELYPASPNPFNSSVKLFMYLPTQTHVSLSIFDINGREVKQLVDRNVIAGNQTFVWNAGDWPTGVYVVRMDAGDVLEMQKVVLVR